MTKEDYEQGYSDAWADIEPDLHRSARRPRERIAGRGEKRRIEGDTASDQPDEQFRGARSSDVPPYGYPGQEPSYVPPNYGYPYPPSPYYGPQPYQPYPYPYPAPYPQMFDPNAIPPYWAFTWARIPEYQGWLWALFSAQGRLEKRRFAIGSSIILIILIAMWTWLFWSADWLNGNFTFAAFLTISGISLFLLWPLTTLCMKRLKDIGETPMLAFVIVLIHLIIPCVAIIVQLAMVAWLMVAEGNPGPNKYGPLPSEYEVK